VSLFGPDDPFEREGADVESSLAYDERRWGAAARAIARRLPTARLRCQADGCSEEVETFYFDPFDGQPTTRIVGRCDRHVLPYYWLDRARLEKNPLNSLVHLDRGEAPSSPRLVAYLRDRGAA
jgi:hypothetical protein